MNTCERPFLKPKILFTSAPPKVDSSWFNQFPPSLVNFLSRASYTVEPHTDTAGRDTVRILGYVVTVRAVGYGTDTDPILLILRKYFSSLCLYVCFENNSAHCTLRANHGKVNATMVLPGFSLVGNAPRCTLQSPIRPLVPSTSTTHFSHKKFTIDRKQLCLPAPFPPCLRI